MDATQSACAAANVLNGMLVGKGLGGGDDPDTGWKFWFNAVQRICLMAKSRWIAALLSAAGLIWSVHGAGAAELGHLRALAGQYTDVLLADRALDVELHAVLGEDYGAFLSVMQVVFPTELVDGRFLLAEGCRAHDCGNLGGLVVIDLDLGTVTVLRRSGSMGAWSPSLGGHILGFVGAPQ